MRAMTRHGERRAAKRSGTGRKAAAKLVERARAEGIPRERTSGNLRRYLDSQYHGHASHYLVVHNGDLFIFASKDGALITMFSLPGNLKHRKAAVGS